MSILKTLWFGGVAALGLALATPAMAYPGYYVRHGRAWHPYHHNRVVIVNPGPVYRYPRQHVYYKRYHPYYSNNVIIVKKHPRHHVYYYR